MTLELERSFDLITEKLGILRNVQNEQRRCQYYLLEKYADDGSANIILTCASAGVDKTRLYYQLLFENSDQRHANVQIALSKNGDVTMVYEGQWKETHDNISGSIVRVSAQESSDDSFNRLGIVLERAAKRVAERFSPQHDSDLWYESLKRKTAEQYLKYGRELSKKFIQVSGEGKASFLPQESVFVSFAAGKPRLNF